MNDHTPTTDTHATSICIDCDTPTFCGHAHGTGHDHSDAAVACTEAALAAGDI